MRIDEQDWKAFIGHVHATLDHFGVTGENREAVVSFVERRVEGGICRVLRLIRGSSLRLS
jgi:hypothetical protein